MQANGIADVAQRQPRLLRSLEALAPCLAGGLDVALVGELRPTAGVLALPLEIVHASFLHKDLLGKVRASGHEAAFCKADRRYGVRAGR